MQPPAIPADPASDAAGLWPRAVAWLIDAAIIALPVYALMPLLAVGHADSLASQWRELGIAMGQVLVTSIERGDAPLALLQSSWQADGPLRMAVTRFASDLQTRAWPVVALFLILGLVYWPLQEAGRRRATLGKRALGLQVETATGEAPDIGDAYRRHLAGSLSWLTLNIGHLLAGNGPRHLALHDRIAKTRVTWRADARHAVPAWGWGVLAIALALPLVIAVRAASMLSAAMQATLGI